MLIRWKPYPSDEYAGAEGGGAADAGVSGEGLVASEAATSVEASVASEATPAAADDKTPAVNNDYDYGDLGDADLESPVEPKADADKASDGESSPSSETEGDAGGDTDESAATEQRSAAPQFDEALLQRAAELQFTYQDVAELGSNKALAAAIRRTEAVLQAAAPKQEPAAPEPTALDQLIARAEANVAAIEEAGHDESILEKARIDLEVLRSTRDREVQQQEYFAQQQQAQRQQAIRERDRRFDGFVNELGDGYSELFGKGSTDSLPATSTERAKREEVRREMHVIAAGRHLNGLPPLPEDQLFKRAVNAAFGDHTHTIARNEVMGKVTKLAKQSLARPSQTRERKLTGEAAAIARVEAFDKAHANDFE